MFRGAFGPQFSLSDFLLKLAGRFGQVSIDLSLDAGDAVAKVFHAGLDAGAHSGRFVLAAGILIVNVRGELTDGLLERLQRFKVLRAAVIGLQRPYLFLQRIMRGAQVFQGRLDVLDDIVGFRIRAIEARDETDKRLVDAGQSQRGAGFNGFEAGDQAVKRATGWRGLFILIGVRIDGAGIARRAGVTHGRGIFLGHFEEHAVDVLADGEAFFARGVAGRVPCALIDPLNAPGPVIGHTPTPSAFRRLSLARHPMPSESFHG